ncbi:MAG TPA: 1,4-dihydroxy-6-naphthoate synthase [Chitinophagaceae bacterium]|nr:1,4-dihydroxy-6-naphthoate synthase [Chitinophagaceae bacterium]
MKLTLGFSPCPNDTFIFDALINKKIDTGDLCFDAVLEDVQTLNNWAMAGKLDISKISYGVLPLVLKEYIVLNAGGALGKGVGPLLISKHAVTATQKIDEKTIAIPGENTTAHMLFSLAYPQAQHKQFIIFSGIEDAVINGKVDLGVIIHENRFTYQQKGLKKVIDLGEYWEQQTQYPVPLGGIVVKRSIDNELQKKIDALIRQSVEYAFENYPALADYVKQHSQEMEENVMRQHIDLYVNKYSIDLGKEGKEAVKKLLTVYNQVNPSGAELYTTASLFVE